jgi:hypothetical protein
MASKKETQEGAVVSPAKAKKAAKADKADKIAAPVEVAPPPAKKPSKVRIPKLPAKNKSRLPRKQKKAAQKLAMAKNK